MIPRWRRVPERGNRALLRLFTWLTLQLGRPISRLCLYPICLYFMAFSGGTRAVSRRYLRAALNRHPAWTDIFRHYHTFASTIHDRVYLLSGRHEYFDVEVQGGAVVEGHIRSGRGCILIGSHLGSFEILRAQGLWHRRIALSVVMHEDGASNLNAILHGLHPGIRDGIIPPGRPDTLLRVRESLGRGELVGILGDRTFGGDKTESCSFLGQPTLFPRGPLMMAALLDAPVILFFGVYLGGRRYRIHFEPFASRIVLSHPRGQGEIRPWVARYVDRLEAYCHRYPYNWFNFYELPPARRLDADHHPCDVAHGG